MNDRTLPHDDEPWRGDWSSARERKLTLGLAASPAQRLAWLEDAILFAQRAGALPRPPR
jgi:hypothetical protein